MVKLIAHRGNLRGPNLERENSPTYLIEALQEGFFVEVDVRLIEGKLYSGHDIPQYPIEIGLLKMPRVYVHAKTISTLHYFLSSHPDVHVFFHNNDEATITSKGEIWTYPGKELTSLSICVMPEWSSQRWENLTNVAGVCSDYLI